MAETLSTLQGHLHRLVANDADTPASTDDDWTIRKDLMNQAIYAWENESDVLWRELWKKETSGGTVAAGTTSYTVSANDFKRPGGYLVLDDGTNQTKIKIIPPHTAQKYQNDVRLAYFTGNPQDGYTLNLLWTPATGDGTTGSTITYDYYKTADQLSASADIPEMPDPMFIVYYAGAEVKRMEDDLNSFTTLNAKAAQSLLQMRVANFTGSPYELSTLEDEGADEDGYAFGL